MCLIVVSKKSGIADIRGIIIFVDGFSICLVTVIAARHCDVHSVVCGVFRVFCWGIII